MDIDLELSSGRLRARQWGPDDAPLLMCVHGLSANLTAFTRLAEHLAGPDRRLVAIDLRGRGRSEITPPGTYGLDSHARDVTEVASALGAEEFDIAGWSLGGLIAMRVAVRDGMRLRSVALIDHAGPADPAAVVPVRAGLNRLDAVVATKDEYLQAVRRSGVIDPWSPFWDAYYSYELQQQHDGEWSPSTSKSAAEEDLNQALPSDWSEHWRALTMPTVLVRALQPLNGGLLVPEAAVDAVLTANPTVRLAELAGSNHFTCMVDPATVAAIGDNLAR